MAEQERWYCTHHPDTFVYRYWQKRGYRTKCWRCDKSYRISQEYRERRAKRWEKEIIACAHHPKLRCSFSQYKLSGHRRCTWCINHYSDGTTRPARKRMNLRSARRLADRKRMARYAKNPTQRKSISEILRMRLGIR